MTKIWPTGQSSSTLFAIMIQSRYSKIFIKYVMADEYKQNQLSQKERKIIISLC